MLHPCEEIFEHSLEPFLDQLVTYLKSHNLLQSGQEIDHVCYRIETINDYLRIVSEMKDKYGKVNHQENNMIKKLDRKLRKK